MVNPTATEQQQQADGNANSIDGESSKTALTVEVTVRSTCTAEITIVNAAAAGSDGDDCRSEVTYKMTRNTSYTNTNNS